jgi:hypothetical protein
VSNLRDTPLIARLNRKSINAFFGGYGHWRAHRGSYLFPAHNQNVISKPIKAVNLGVMTVRATIGDTDEIRQRHFALLPVPEWSIAVTVNSMQTNRRSPNGKYFVSKVGRIAFRRLRGNWYTNKCVRRTGQIRRFALIYFLVILKVTSTPAGLTRYTPRMIRQVPGASLRGIAGR